jgi:hypothetical protein
MARVAAILKALRVAFRRDWKSFGSIATNTFFPVTLLLLQKAGAFVYLLAGVVTIFPMSTDPLRKIPRSRLESWPLTRRERWILRVSSPWMNPVTWALAAGAIWAARGKLTAGLWAAVAGLVAIGFAISELPPARSIGLWRRVPAFPGVLGQLMRKNVREILSTLDFYLALLLSVSAAAYRAAGFAVPPEALLQLTLLMLLALASYSQCLFGLDGKGGMSRYRLLPLRGWQILAAKDAAFVAVAVALASPAAPLAGFGAALVCAGMGHGPSVNFRGEQVRWRFSSGVSIYFGLAQTIAMGAAGAAIAFTSRWTVVACGAGWAVSTWWYGAKLEKTSNE